MDERKRESCVAVGARAGAGVPCHACSPASLARVHSPPRERSRSCVVSPQAPASRQARSSPPRASSTIAPSLPSRHRCCQCHGPHSRHRASAADRHRRSFRHVWHSVDIGQDPCKDEAGCSAGSEGQAAEEGRAGRPGEEPGGAKAREVAQRLGKGLRAGEGSQGRVFLPRSVRTQYSAQHDPVNAILATSPQTSEDA